MAKELTTLTLRITVETKAEWRALAAERGQSVTQMLKALVSECSVSPVRSPGSVVAERAVSPVPAQRSKLDEMRERQAKAFLKKGGK